MTQMHDVNFFWGIQKIGKRAKITKFRSRDTVREIEHPFRICRDAFFMRISRKRLLVIGQWQETGIVEHDPDSNEEDLHLMGGLEGEILDWDKEEVKRRTKEAGTNQEDLG